MHERPLSGGGWSSTWSNQAWPKLERAVSAHGFDDPLQVRVTGLRIHLDHSAAIVGAHVSPSFLPESVQSSLVRVVPTNLGDASALDPHQLACGDVEVAPIMLGGGVLNGNDIRVAAADVQESRAEGAAGQWVELGEEVVSYRRPAPVGARDAAGTRQQPNRVVGEAAGGGVEIVVSDRGVEALHDVDGAGIAQVIPPGTMRLAVRTQP
jgi:hypothetical protein